MKKSIIFLIALIALLFAGCAQQEPEDLALGTYEMEQSQEPVAPYIVLEENQTFQMMYSVLSSYLPIGTYEVSGETLTLTTEDGKYTYIFHIDGDSLVFQKNQSSPLQIGGKAMVEDGAAFRLNRAEE